MRAARFLAFVTVFGACAKEAPKPTAPPTPGAAPTATVTAVIAATGAPSVTTSALAAAVSRDPFQTVVVARAGDGVGLTAVGPRAIIRVGGETWGYAQAKQIWVHDAHFVPKAKHEAKSHLQLLAGLWPDLAVTYCDRFMIEYMGTTPQLFTSKNGAFVEAKVTWPEIPQGLVYTGGVAYAFAPSSSYWIAGQNSTLCGQTAPAEQPVQVVQAGRFRPAPRATPSYFLQSLGEDGAKHPWAIGADHCHAGQYLARLESSPWKTELVPTSERCEDRSNVEGMPYLHATLYPSARGGLFVALANRAPMKEYYPDEKAGPECMTPPRVLERGPDGAWSPPREFPTAEGALEQVDENGTAWLVTERGTVVRVPLQGERQEYGLGQSCAHPPSGADAGASLAVDTTEGHHGLRFVTVPFADQPWISVAYQGGRLGLCMANLAPPRPDER